MVLGTATACYELYNVFVVLLFIPEYRTPIHMAHHVTTFLLALFGRYPFLHYVRACDSSLAALTLLLV